MCHLVTLGTDPLSPRGYFNFTKNIDFSRRFVVNFFSKMDKKCHFSDLCEVKASCKILEKLAPDFLGESGVERGLLDVYGFTPYSIKKTCLINFDKIVW
jgi:hypothetical protein